MATSSPEVISFGSCIEETDVRFAYHSLNNRGVDDATLVVDLIAQRHRGVHRGQLLAILGSIFRGLEHHLKASVDRTITELSIDCAASFGQDFINACSFIFIRIASELQRTQLAICL